MKLSRDICDDYDVLFPSNSSIFETVMFWELKDLVLHHRVATSSWIPGLAL